MKLSKKLIALLLTAIFIFSFAVPAFSASDESVDFADAVAQVLGTDTSENKKFTADKALKTALTAAKAKYAIEGIPSDISEKAVVTKASYDKNSGSYTITVRAERKYKYVCVISVKTFLGSELGLPEDSEYIQQGSVSSFFCQIGEKVSYFFIRIFGKDGPKE